MDDESISLLTSKTAVIADEFFHRCNRAIQEEGAIHHEVTSLGQSAIRHTCFALKSTTRRLQWVFARNNVAVQVTCTVIAEGRLLTIVCISHNKADTSMVDQIIDHTRLSGVKFTHGGFAG